MIRPDSRVPLRGVAAFAVLAVAGPTIAQDASATLLAARSPQFVANRGQWPASARFLCDVGGSRTWLGADGLWLAREQGEIGAAVRFAFEGGAGTARGVQPLPTLRHWLRSPDVGPDVTSVPAYAGVVQQGLYPDVDLVLRSDRGYVEYDLVAAPGADLSRIVVAVDGHDAMRLAADGSLRFDTAVGELRQTPPRTYVADARGARTELPSRFELLGDDRFTIRVDGWVDGALTIDPGLIWGSFLGGAGLDRCTGVAVDSTGAAVVVGNTASANLPTTPGVYRATAVGGTDAFVAKIAADGTSLLFCTYVGGTADETATAVQVLTGDRIAIAGHTNSGNYPLTGNRYQATLGGGIDGFVTQLPANGAALLYSSYFGGTANDTDLRLWVQPDEDIWLAGRCLGSTQVTANGFQQSHGSLGSGDVFVAVLERSVPSTTSLRYGSYFGGSADERSVDSLHVMTTGGGQEIGTIGFTTDSTNCPLGATPYQAAMVGSAPSGFVVQFDPAPAVASQTLVYATYFGAAGGTTRGVRTERDSAGLLMIAATTSSPNWPTTPIAYQRLYAGGASDIIAGRLDPPRGSTALVLATYLGGNGDDVAEGLAYLYQAGSVDLATVVGSTTSTNFPVSTAALQSQLAGTGGSGFVAQLDFRLFLNLMLRYSSYFDGLGVGDEVLRSVHRSAAGELTVAGESNSLLAPGRTPFQAAPAGGIDGFVARLDTVAQPASFTAVGTGCGMPGEVPVLAAGLPPRIAQPFSVNLNNLLPNGGGFMILGFDDQLWLGAVPLPRDLAPHGMPGCTQYIDTAELFLVLNSGTSTTFGLTVPPAMDFYGINFFLQFLMADARVNSFGFAITNAARLNIHW